MDNLPKRRGRVSGQVKAKVTIKDPLLGKYHIEVDDHSFNVWEEGKTDANAYCTTLGGALAKVCKYQIIAKQNTMDLKQYMAEFKTVLTQLQTIS